MTAVPYKCQACGRIRPSPQLLAFWPAGEPLRRRFVCRPSVSDRIGGSPCFRELVGPRDVHEIGRA